MNKATTIGAPCSSSVTIDLGAVEPALAEKPARLAREIAKAVVARERRPPRWAVAAFGAVGTVLGIAFLGWRYVRQGSRKP